MSVFVQPVIGRDGLDRVPLAYLGLQRRQIGIATSPRTEFDLFGSEDGLHYRQRKIAGDIVSVASRMFIRTAANAQNMVAINGRLILVAHGVDGAGQTHLLIFTSDNGWFWTLRSHPLEGPSAVGLRQFYGLAVFGAMIVAVVRSGETLISEDGGDTWVAGAHTGLANVTGLAANSQAIVAVGTGGGLRSSVNPLLAWTTRDSKFGTTQINAVAGTETGFMIVAGGKIASGTSNATSWALRWTGDTVALTRVFSTGTRWYAAGDESWMSSPDGTTWGNHPNPYWVGGRDLLYRVVQGPAGTILHWGEGGVAYTLDETTWLQAEPSGIDVAITAAAQYRDS